MPVPGGPVHSCRELSPRDETHRASIMVKRRLLLLGSSATLLTGMWTTNQQLYILVNVYRAGS